jgi:hypothetical protein
MAGHIIDCCSLLNLYTGWGRLAELRALKRTWHVCQAVLDEAEYTREYGADGTPVLVPLRMSEVNRDAVLLPACIATDAEMQDYVNFANELDDGEAQALSIAKHRGFVLLSDDRKAMSVARRADVAVPTTSTPEVLRAWAQLEPQNAARLVEIVRRITVLARFRPRADSADYPWWNACL